MRNYYEIVNDLIGIDNNKVDAIIAKLELSIADTIRDNQYKLRFNLGNENKTPYYLRRIILDRLKLAGWHFTVAIDIDYNFVVDIMIGV